MEEWRDIPNYEGLYQVSNMGRVKKSKRNSIITQNKSKTGRYKVMLHKNKVLKTCKIANLVAMAFLDHKPCGFDIIVCNKDGDFSNNKLENIKLTTVREASSINKNGTSKYTGVHRHKKSGKFEARIRIRGGSYYLGLFECEDEAGKEYIKILNEYENYNRITRNLSRGTEVTFFD